MMLTRGSDFGGFSSDIRDRRPEGFWDSIVDAHTRGYRRPGDDFVNASGKTDLQENYEWKQHQKSWYEYVVWRFEKVIAKMPAPECKDDPRLLYSRKYEFMVLVDWDPKQEK